MIHFLQDFLKDPWKPVGLHDKYKQSFFHLKPVPEVTTGEVMLASLYRNVGFMSNSFVSEKVWRLGTPFRNMLDNGRRPNNRKSEACFDSKLWSTVVNKVIASPNLAGQSRQRGSQTTPLVPDATLYSMSARLKGNTWNPGNLVARMIALGSGDYNEALVVWQKLFDKLSIKVEEDDVWARLLQSEFESWRTDDIISAWQRPNNFPHDISTFHGNFNIDYPAKRFVQDLLLVLDLKQDLTRKQWISMLESLCRIGSSAHVMWSCRVHDICREFFEQALNTGTVPNEAELLAKLSIGNGFWSIGQITSKPIKESARHYIEGRGAINLLLHMLECSNFDMSKINIESPFQAFETLKYLAKHQGKFNFDQYLIYFNQMMESEPKIAECKKGTSKNVLEFLEHIARQRITSETGLESYDQGYYFEKRNNYQNAPWVVGLGPLSTLLMVHCAALRKTGPCTVQDLCDQLAGYGINAEMALGKGEKLNKRLRDMSIAIDSPDAEGGMVINSPLLKNSVRN